MKREPLDVLWILGDITTQAIEFGEYWFYLHPTEVTPVDLPAFTPPCRYPRRRHE